MLVGHTHDIIDQVFSRVSAYLKTHDAITLSELEHVIRVCYNVVKECKQGELQAATQEKLKVLINQPNWEAGLVVDIKNSFLDIIKHDPNKTNRNKVTVEVDSTSKHIIQAHAEVMRLEHVADVASLVKKYVDEMGTV